MKKTSTHWMIGLGFIDIVVVVLLFFLSPTIRQLLPPQWLHSAFSLDDHRWILFLSLLFHFLLSPFTGSFESLRSKGLTRVLRTFVLNVCIQFLMISTLVFLLKAQTTSRSFVGLFILSSQFLCLIFRVMVSIYLQKIKPSPYQKRRVLLIADHPDPHLMNQLREDPHWQSMLVQIVPSAKFKEGFDEELFSTPIDDCVVDCPSHELSNLSRGLQILETRGVQVHFTLRCIPLSQSHFGFSFLDHRPLLSTQKSILTPEAKTLKRAVDIIFSLVGLVITAILTPFMALAIKLDSPGPIFFIQNRIGQGGRQFRCYKFRTMVAQAEALKENLQVQNQMSGPIFKIKNDPRVTRVGRFLRRTSLDELPQFINIFRGEMSLIGTRPPTPHEVAQYSHSDFRRVSVKPGLTGLWQVSGRNEIRQFEDIVALDLFYIDHWSLWMDLRIILKTLWVLVAGKGAS